MKRMKNLQVVRQLLKRLWRVKRHKPLSLIRAQRTTWMKPLMMKTSSLVVRKSTKNVTFNLTPVPEMDQSVLILQFLQLDIRRKVRWTMCLSK